MKQDEERGSRTRDGLGEPRLPHPGDEPQPAQCAGETTTGVILEFTVGLLDVPSEETRLEIGAWRRGQDELLGEGGDHRLLAVGRRDNTS